MEEQKEDTSIATADAQNNSNKSDGASATATATTVKKGVKFDVDNEKTASKQADFDSTWLLQRQSGIQEVYQH